MADEPIPQIAFAFHDEPTPRDAIEIHVNFGVFAGREATPAEIDRLAGWMLDEVEHVTIVSEIRHEIDRHSEAAVHQIRVEAPGRETADASKELEHLLVERAELWARMCVADRPVPAPAATTL